MSNGCKENSIDLTSLLLDIIEIDNKKTKIKNTFGTQIPYRRGSLMECIAELNKTEQCFT